MGAYPALSIRPPEDNSEGIKNAFALKGMLQNQQLQGQQMQLNQLNIEKQKQAEHDRQAVIDLYKKHQGNTDKIVADAPNAGISPDAIQQLQLHSIAEKKNALELVKSQGEKAVADADKLKGAVDILDQTPEADRAATWQQLHAQLAAQQVDMTGAPAEYPGPDGFKLMHVAVQSHSKLIADAAAQAGLKKTEAETGKELALGEQAKANTAKLQQEMQFYQAKGLAPGVPMDVQEAADWLGKNKGKGAADFMKYKASLVPQMNFNLQNAMPKGEGGQPSAAVQGLADGTFKWGDIVNARTPMAVKMDIARQVKAIKPDFNTGDYTIEQGVRKAFTTGKPAEELVAFNTAITHADLLKKAADAMDNGDILVLNSIGNQLGVQFGSDKATNFKVISQAYTAEVNKALTAGHVTDTELKKIGETIPSNASPAQIKGAVDAYKGLMAGKKAERQKQLEAGLQGKSTLQTEGTSGGTIRARDPQGKLHEAPAGTPLPAGWKLEQ